MNEKRIRKSGGHARGIEDTSVIRMSRAIFCTMDSNLCFTSEPFIIFFFCVKRLAPPGSILWGHEKLFG